MANQRNRVLILIIDGLGIGAMPDVSASRPLDEGANTLLHVVESVDTIHIPELIHLGLAELAALPGMRTDSPVSAFGCNMLAYCGADTYMGHQEMMGTIPGIPRHQLMREVRDIVWEALTAAGHQVEEYLPPSPMLLVDGAVVIADNMETDPGRNINVTASYDDLPVAHIVEIGELVRSVVEVSRVIVVMGSGFGFDAIGRHIRTGPEDTVGVDSPGLGVYNERYRVRHLGIGVDPLRQVPGIAAEADLPVYLLGKAADVVHCDGAIRSRDVATRDVLRKTLETLRETPTGLIVSNVQEGDLAGHAEDPQRWADVLQQIDAALPEIISLLGSGDLLLVVGDHGNDPVIGHSQHTREMTPLLVVGPRVKPVPLGRRTSLADIAATTAEALGIERPADGVSFYQDLYGR